MTFWLSALLSWNLCICFPPNDESPRCRPAWLAELVSGPGGVPTGVVMSNNGASDFTFDLGNPVSSGSANTDVPGPTGLCGETGTCLFTGDWQLVGPVVPEPASAALF